MVDPRDDCSDMSSGEEFHDNVYFGEYDDLRSTYPSVKDFQSDGFYTDDFQSEDFRTEEFQSEDFHSTYGSRMADDFEQLDIGEALPGESSTSFRSSRYREGESANFFQGIDCDENSDVILGTDARSTTMSTGSFAGNFPPTLSALPDLAGNSEAGLCGNDSLSSYNQSSGVAHAAVGTNTYDNENGFDVVNSYGHLVPRPPFTGQAVHGQDRRWASDDQPWNHLYPSTTRGMTQLSEFTYASQGPPSTAYSSSALTPSESGPSLSSYFAGPGTSNTSGDVFGHNMTDSQATVRPVECDSRPMSGNGPGFANTPRWGSYDYPGVANQALAYSHGAAHMHESTESRPKQSGVANPDVGPSRHDSTSSGPTGAHTHAEQREVLECPIDGCRAKFRGGHQRGSLHRHMRMKHSTRREEGTVTYPCEVAGCMRIFMRMDSRLKHYRKRHEHLNVPPAVPRK